MSEFGAQDVNMRKKLIVVFNLVIIALSFITVDGQTRKAVSAREVNGTFRARSGSEFKILALGRGRLRVAFSGVYEFNSAMGRMANVGEARGEAEIAGDTAVFLPEETEQCTITLKFLTGSRLQVAQRGTDADCGFGVNVNAGGLYKKISAAKPQF
jgi:hypothetical protein